MPDANLLMNRDQIRQAVVDLSDRISKVYSDPALLIVLRGGFFFGADLAREIGCSEFYFYDPKMPYLDVIRLHHLISDDRLIVVDTICTTGATLERVQKHLDRTLTACVLLRPTYGRGNKQKKGQPRLVNMHYVGYEPTVASNAWYEGYGLDPARHLPFIRKISREPSQNGHQ